MESNWKTILNQATLAVLAGTICALLSAADSVTDARRGGEVFEKRCTGCHSLDKNKTGPRLRGVYGRQAAKDGDFRYSDAVKSARVVWDESTLDRWLTDTESVIPGNEMPFRLESADDRRIIIAYLKQLPAK